MPRGEQRPRRGSFGLMLVLLVLSAVAISGVPARQAAAQRPPAIGGPFNLLGVHGHRVTDEDFRGRWMLIYFGYTTCPDICPTTLAEIAQVLERLGPLSAKIQPIFITIDPERDTADAVDAYVKAFDSRIIGLTGTSEEIAQVAGEYRVYYAKRASADGDPKAYLMDHSAFVYLAGPDGKYLTLFMPTRNQGPDDIASALRQYIARPPDR